MNKKKKFKIIGAIGDIHGEDQLLAKAIAFLKKQGVEIIFSVGDIVDGSGDVERCCQILMREKVQAVAGNHEEWFLKNQLRDLRKATQLDEISNESKSYLSSLTRIYEFETVHGLGLLCHGLDENNMAKVTPDDYGYAIEVNKELQDLIQERKYKYVINGHTHDEMVRHFGYLTIINAGTLKRTHDPGFLIVDFEKGIVDFFKFDPEFEIEKAKTVGI